MLWRKYNVGASRPEESGLFVSWGNTDGHTANDDYDFTQSVYDSTPGALIESNLDSSNDFASVYLGNPWRMPLPSEFLELRDNCTSEWVSFNGVYGRMFTSNNNGKTIFLPATGKRESRVLINENVSGYYWSSQYYSEEKAKYCGFDRSGLGPNSEYNRRDGFVIRAVREP